MTTEQMIARMIQNWISENNVYAFLSALGWELKYDFDPDEWRAIRFGIRDSDHEAGIWYDYVFAGEKRAEFRLSLDQGSSVVFIELTVPPELEERLDMLLEFLGRFDVTESGPARID